MRIVRLTEGKLLMSRKITCLNLIISVISTSIALILGLIVPRIVLIYYGSDTNGLIGTITQIFSYMALLEAGIGQAALNALYGPIQKNDKQAIADIYASSRSYFKRVTNVYAILVLLLSFVLPVIIKSELEYFTIFGCVFFEGAAGVINFYYIQTDSILLVADGRTYIKSIIELIHKVLGYSMKIWLALLAVKILYVQFGFFILSLIKMLLYHREMVVHYPWLVKNKSFTHIVLPYRRSFLITELAWIIFSSTDLIVLSFFCSTKLASVYSVNSLIYSALNALIYAAYGGIYYLLGKTYHEDKNKYIHVHDLFNSFFMSLVVISMSVALLLSEGFVKLYTNRVQDIQYVYHWLPLMFCLVQILSWSRFVSGNLTSIAGYAKQVSYVSIIEAAINISLSIILVHFCGIYGVLFATVVALPIKVIYTNYISDIKILRRSPKKTVSIFILNYLVFAVAIIINQNINITFDSYKTFVAYGFLLAVVFSVFVFVLNSILNPDLRHGVLEIRSIIFSRLR